MTRRVHFPLFLLILAALGICFTAARHGEATQPPRFALDLASTLDSEEKHSLRIGLLEPGETEYKDIVPPPEASGFDFYILTGLAPLWDRLSVHLVPDIAGVRLYSWLVVGVATSRTEVTISWDASGAPADINPYFVEIDVETGEPVGHLEDMKTTTSVVIEGGVLTAITKAFEFRMYLNLPPVLNPISDRSTGENEELDEQRKKRDPVAPARQSASARKKKTTGLTPDGFPVHSFETLLKELATRSPAGGGVQDPIGPVLSDIPAAHRTHSTASASYAAPGAVPSKRKLIFAVTDAAPLG